MNLFEYQGKDLYKKYSITTPKSIFIKSISDLTENHGLSYPLVVKAQVLSLIHISEPTRQ